MKHRLKTFLIPSVLAVALIGCTGNGLNNEVADRIASPSWMQKRQIAAGSFNLTAFERMHERAYPANIYIAGDGTAVLETPETLAKPVTNPTPKNPVALHLASKDKAENLAYIARPCQYSPMPTPEEACPAELWTDGRYSPQVTGALNAAIDNIKNRYDITTVNLIGYSGGATLAALLASQRKDVMSLRTVNGKFDMGALNTSIPALRNMPQHHFIGGNDTIAGMNAFTPYMAALGETRCSDYTIIASATHDTGFVDPWPELLEDKAPRCKTPDAPTFEPIPEPRKTVYVPHMGDSKK